MTFVHYHNDGWYTKDALRISPFDIGYLRAYGIFDVIRSVQGKLFHPQGHIDRFISSAQELGFDPIPTESEIIKLLHDGIVQNDTRGGSGFYDIRLVMSGGVGADSTSLGTATFVILFEAGHVYPDDWYTQGIAVKTIPMERHLPHIKSLNYFQPIYERRTAMANGYKELLLVNKNNEVTEGATSNLFIVKDGTLITPKQQIVVGVTRNIVIELARSLGNVVQERALSQEELYRADECFITGTSKKIVPVWKVDSTEIQVVGKITQQLIGKYSEIK